MPVLILLDMLALGVEVLFEPKTLSVAVLILMALALIRWRFGPIWTFQVAFLMSLGAALFIFVQTGSAWGVGLRIYLIPSQLAVWGGWLLVTLGAMVTAR
jgi:hypothetical protein